MITNAIYCGKYRITHWCREATLLTKSYPTINNVKTLLGALGGKFNYIFDELRGYLFPIELARFDGTKLCRVHNFPFFTSCGNPKRLRPVNSDVVNFVKMSL